MPPRRSSVGAVAAAAASAAAAAATTTAAAAAAAEAEAAEAATPLSMAEVTRLGRFVYEAGLPQPCRFYCGNKASCGRLFAVAAHLLDPGANQALSEAACRVACPFCNRDSCARCRILHHGALTCAEVQAMEAERAAARESESESGGGGGGGGGATESGLSLQLIRATSKPCPSCRISISHYHGHACHHIAPGTGCVNCGHHFCFSCLQPAGPAVLAGSPGCRCPAYCSNDDVLANIKNLPIPHDARCGCVFCPDCKCTIIPATAWDNRRGSRRGTSSGSSAVAGEGMTVVPFPCAQCDGTCVVCVGLVTPGEVSVHKSGRLSMSL
jgi:hypothetical protein